VPGLPPEIPLAPKISELWRVVNAFDALSEKLTPDETDLWLAAFERILEFVVRRERGGGTSGSLLAFELPFSLAPTAIAVFLIGGPTVAIAGTLASLIGSGLILRKILRHAADDAEIKDLSQQVAIRIERLQAA